MTIGEFKAFIEKNQLPDDMLMGLLDMSTDDFHDANYGITEDTLLVEDCVKEEGGPIEGKMLFLTFENCLNENPIL